MAYKIPNYNKYNRFKIICQRIFPIIWLIICYCVLPNGTQLELKSTSNNKNWLVKGQTYYSKTQYPNTFCLNSFLWNKCVYQMFHFPLRNGITIIHRKIEILLYIWYFFISCECITPLSSFFQIILKLNSEISFTI